MQISASILSNMLMNLQNRYFGGFFSSKELTTILKSQCGRQANRVLEEFENHGVIEFMNSKKCRFICTPTEENIKNLIWEVL